MADILGKYRFRFAGAYTRHGFHEVGIVGALRAARLIEERVVV